MSINKEDYLCLSAMLRARETKLLPADKAVRMLELSGADEAARQLTECGYPDYSGLNASELNAALAERREEIFHEMERLSPEPDYIKAFRLKYDSHNIKAIIKSEAMGSSPEKLLSVSGRFAPEKLYEDYNNDNFKDYPELFAAAVREARSTLARTSDPQASDIVLDKAYFAELKAMAEKLKDVFFSDYVTLMIDSANLKSIVRTLRIGKNRDFTEQVLIPGGSVDTQKLLEVKDPEKLPELFKSKEMADAVKLAKAAVEGSGMTAFEKECDNAVTAYLRASKYVSYGPEALLNYLASIENEITAVRMILTGLQAGIDGSVIKERLRDMYA